MSHFNFLVSLCRAWTAWKGPPLIARVPPVGEQGGEEEREAGEGEGGEEALDGGAREHPRTSGPRHAPASRLMGSRMDHNLVNIPPTGGDPHPRLRCKVCYMKQIKGKQLGGSRTRNPTKTRLWCDGCKVALCSGCCDAVFHTKKDYWNWNWNWNWKSENVKFKVISVSSNGNEYFCDMT